MVPGAARPLKFAGTLLTAFLDLRRPIPCESKNRGRVMKTRHLAVAALFLCAFAPGLHADGTITGVVTDGGQAVVGQGVQAERLVDNVAFGATTGSSGEYTLNLPAGVYRVRVFSGQDYVGEYHSNVSQFDGDLATPVIVTDGGTATIDFDLARAGFIAGTVTFCSGATPSGGVEAHDAVTNRYRGGGGVDGSGSFTIGNLPAGRYKLWVNPEGSDCAFQWLGPAIRFAQAAEIQLAANEDRTLATPITLPPGTSISGHITLSDTGNPTQISVQALDPSTGEGLRGAAPNESGVYEIKNLPADGYFIQANTQSTGFILEYWSCRQQPCGTDDTTRFEQAEPVTSPATGKDFTLEKGGRILGRVCVESLPANGVCDPGEPGVQGAQVHTDFRDVCCFSQWTSTDSNGDFVVNGLPGGRYSLTVQHGVLPSGQLFVSERWNDKTVFEPGDPIDVDLAVNGGVVTGKDLPVSTGLEISGMVCADLGSPPNGACDAGELPVVGATIRLFRASDDWCCDETRTDGDGAYRIAERAGDYHVQATPNGGTLVPEFWQNAFFQQNATDVPAGTPNVDLSLEDGAVQGTLRGRLVRDVLGTGIGGIDVSIQRFNDASYLTGTRTAPDGSFAFVNLPAGEYKVLFDTQNSNRANNEDYVAEYWSRCQTEACDPQTIDPNDIKVVYPEPAPLGKDLGTFELAQGGSISGRVCVDGQPCDGTGLPSSLRVRLQSFVSGGPSLPFLPETTVNSDGTYRVRGLPAPLAYRVRADVDNSTSDYIRAYYQEPLPPVAPAFDAGTATAVEVSVGGLESGKDIYLFQGGAISGRVLCETGVGALNVNVSFNIQNFGTGTNTNSTDGNYLVRGLPPGSYHVQTNVRDLVSCEGDPTPRNLGNVSLNNVSVLTGQETAGQDLTLVPGGSISGRVTYTTPTPEELCNDASTERGVVNIRVAAYDFVTGEFVSDAQTSGGPCPSDWGFYTINALPQGRQYALRVETKDNEQDPLFFNFVRVWWATPPTPYGQDRDAVPPAGFLGATPVTDIDFHLVLGGAISGILTDDVGGGTPLTGAGACANPFSRGGFGECGYADQNGVYIIRGLPEGDFRVSAFPPGPPNNNYVSECFDDVIDCGQATPVSVPAVGQPVPGCPTTGGIPVVCNINFRLGAGFTIRGTVTDKATSQPVPNVRMVAKQFDPPFGYGETQTDGFGKYTISGLPSGVFDVVAFWHASYALKRRQANAGDTAVDFQLEPGGAIHGRVTIKDEPGPDNGVDGAGIAVYDCATNRPVSPDGPSVQATNPDGTYSFAGLLGSFKIEAEDQQGQNLVNVFWNQKLRQEEADCVTIDAAADDFQIDFQMPRGREIRGRVFYDADNDGVQDPGESGLDNIRVELNSDSGFGFNATTGSNGDFAIQGVLGALLDGTPVIYRAQVRTQGTPYASEFFRIVGGTPLGTYRWDRAELLDVSGGDKLCQAQDRTDCIDFSLVLGGAIAGTLRDEMSGLQLPGINVYVNPFDVQGIGFGATTNAQGQYLIDGLPPAGVEAGYPGTYRVQTDDPSGTYVSEFWDNKLFYDQANAVLVMATQTRTADFLLGQGGFIEGFVTTGGQAVRDVNIQIQEFGGDQRCCLGSGNHNTDAVGHFRIGGLPLGIDFRVQANPPSGSFLAREYWDGGNGSTNRNAAVPVQASDPPPMLNFDLGAGGTISGRVFDGNGTPLGNYCCVSAQPLSGAGGSGTSTRPDGTYTIEALAPGSYSVNTGGNGGLPFEVYNNKPDGNSATPVPVVANQDTPGIDFYLAVPPQLAGTVTCSPPSCEVVRGGPAITVTIPASSLAGALCGGAPCSTIDGGGLQISNASLIGGTFQFDVTALPGVPLGGRGFVIVNRYQVEDAFLAIPGAVDVIAGAPGPAPAGGRLYASDQEPSQVLVFAAADNSVVAQIETADFPDSLALSADGQYLFAAGSGRALSVIDLRLGQEIYRTLAVGAVNNHALAATADFIYTANREFGSFDRINLFDARTWQPAGTIPLPAGANPTGLRIDPQGRWLYVANQNTASVSVICVNPTMCGPGNTAGTLHARIDVALPAAPLTATGSPRGIAFTPNGQFAYVVSQQRTYVIDTQKALTDPANALVDARPELSGVNPIPTGGGGNGMIDIVDVPYAGKALAFIGQGGGQVRVVDAATHQILRTLQSPTQALTRLRVSADGTKLYVSSFFAKDIHVVDTAGLVAGPGGPEKAVVFFTRIARDLGPSQPLLPTAMAWRATEPGAASLTAPEISGITESPALPGDTVTITGNNFDAVSADAPIVWLVGSQLRGEVLARSDTSLDVRLPATTPAGAFRIAVTNIAATGSPNESGVSAPGTTLTVNLPAYARTQNVLVSGDGKGEVVVYEPDGSRHGIEPGPGGGVQPEAAGIALTPDGKRGVVQQLYAGAQPDCNVLPRENFDMAVFDLDTASPNFRKVLGHAPYVWGGFESPAITSNQNNPNILVYQANRFFSDSVSILDPRHDLSNPAEPPIIEVDIDNNPLTQSYPSEFICDNFDIGSKLSGINRVHLDSNILDFDLRPNDVALTPDGSLLYVANMGVANIFVNPTVPGSVSIIDTVTRQVKARITKYGLVNDRHSFGFVFSVAVSPDGTLVYVLGFDNTGVPSLFILRAGVFEDSAASFVTKVEFPTTPFAELPRSIAVSPDGSAIYTVARSRGELFVVQRGANDAHSRVDPPIPLGIGVGALAVAPADRLLYVVNVFQDVIDVLDISSPTAPQVVGHIAGPVGSVDVAVQPAIGAPRIDFVSPNKGPVEGGTPIVIAGANFPANAEVRFGTGFATCDDTGTLAAASVANSFTINGTTPAGFPAGPVDVKVTNPADGQCDFLTAAFTYEADTTPPVFITPPYVASQQLTGVAPNEKVTAEFRWVTDEVSDSTLEYDTTAGFSSSQAGMVTDAANVKSHVITVQNLTPGTLYYFRAKSKDLAMPPHEAVSPTSTFTTLSQSDTTPPFITGPLVSTTHNSATITWDTNEPADSAVDYDAAIGGGYDYTVLFPVLVQSHSVTLTNLPADTLHEFRVRSKDLSNNPASKTGQFTTKPVPDTVPPQLSAPTVSYLSNNLVVITWETNEPATSFVNYGTSSVLEQSVFDASLVYTHIVFLTNLHPNTSYGYQYGSTDASGNTAVSADPFAPAAGPQAATLLTQDRHFGPVTARAGTMLEVAAPTAGFTTPGLSDNTGPVLTSPLVVTSLSCEGSPATATVRLSTTTNEAASIRADYTTAGVTLTAFDPTFTQTPSLLLAGLSCSATYGLVVTVADPKGNTTTETTSFTTPDAPDQTPPIITGLSVGSITDTSALVTWTTNELATTGVRFGPQGGAITGQAGVPGLRTSHSVLVTGLTPGTTYALYADSTDASGNTGAAGATPFTTAHQPPVITSLAPNLAAQGASLSVGINGARFEQGATVFFGAGVTVSEPRLLSATRIDADITVAPDAAIGARTATVTNPSGLAASAAFSIVDQTPPGITITEPANEVATSSVTVRGTLSEDANVTINGLADTDPDPRAFQAVLSLTPGVNTIDVTATDPSGNTGTASRSVKFLTVSIADTNISENGGSAAFTLTLSAPSSGVSVNYQTSNGTAQAPGDYVAAPAGSTFTFPANALTATLLVPVVSDSSDEPDETFSVTLTGGGAAIVGGTATATLLDDDGPPSVSIADASVTEGNSGTRNVVFKLTLSQPSGFTVTVDYQTANGSAQAGSDYVAAAAGSSISFPPGTTMQTVNVVVNGDTAAEPNETFLINLTSATNATISDGQAVGTILDDEPRVSINDVTVTEGNTGKTTAIFTVTLSVPGSQAVSVSYATADSTATAASGDYVAKSGSLNFPSGTTSQTIGVTVNGDRTTETDETFFVNLTGANGAIVTDNQGQGTIRDDDAPTISINDVAVSEGNAGSTNANFTVSLSGPSSLTVTVGFQTADGSATAVSGDYVSGTGTLTFAPNTTTQTITITVNGDTAVEPSEMFFVNLSGASGATIADAQGLGTIRDDDGTLPSVSISDTTVVEGTDGTPRAQFAVTLSAPSSQTVTVAYATMDGSATAVSGDYIPASGTVTFASGHTSELIKITVNGDMILEGNETFLVRLLSPAGVVLGKDLGQATIQELSLRINDVPVVEGQNGKTNATFTVALSYPTTTTVTVDYTTANGTAMAPSDYTARSGSLTLSPGVTSQTVTISVNGDKTAEPNETFFVNLNNNKKALIADGQGVGTIQNDDGP